MNRKWLAALLVGAAVSAAFFSVGDGLLAQNTGIKIGSVACVDVILLFNEYQRQKDLNEELKQIQDALEQEDQQRRARIAEYEETISVMDSSDPAMTKRMAELLEMQIQYKNWGEIKRAHLTREAAIWSARIYEEILKATETVAKNQGHTIVLYKDQFQFVPDPQAIQEQIRLRKLIYADPTVDISQAVLDRLNADYRAQPRQKMLQIP